MSQQWNQPQSTQQKTHAFIFFGARCNQPHLLFSSSQGADSSVISCPCPPASSFLSCWSAQLLPAVLSPCSFSRSSPSPSSPGKVALGEGPSWDHQTPGWFHRETRHLTYFMACWAERNLPLNFLKLCKDNSCLPHRLPPK